MGILYKGSCSVCGYRGEFSLGGGRLGCMLKENLRVLCEKEREEIKAMMDRDEINSFDIENKLTLCDTCPKEQALKARTIITVYDKMGNKKIFGGVCLSCGAVLKIFDNVSEPNNNNIKCPDCNKGEISFEPVGFWD